jgi:hypothetical protein
VREKTEGFFLRWRFHLWCIALQKSSIFVCLFFKKKKNFVCFFLVLFSHLRCGAGERRKKSSIFVPLQKVKLFEKPSVFERRIGEPKSW